MSKTITIKNKKWEGTVTLFDRLFLSQVEAIEEALLDTPPAIEREIIGKEGKKEKVFSTRFTHLDKPKIPALLACVEKWEIKDFPENPTLETFPLTPRKPAHDLIEQIFDEIKIIYNGEIEVPNE